MKDAISSGQMRRAGGLACEDLIGLTHADLLQLSLDERKEITV